MNNRFYHVFCQRSDGTSCFASGESEAAAMARLPGGRKEGDVVWSLVFRDGVCVESTPGTPASVIANVLRRVQIRRGEWNPKRGRKP